METKNHSDTRHPREEASFWSHLFFCWELPFLYKGYRKQISENDLYGPLEEHQSKLLGDRLEDAWLEELRTTVDPSVWRVLAKVFGFKFLKLFFILIPTDLVLRLFKPIFLGKIISYYSGHSTVSKTEVYIYSIALVLVSFVCVISMQHFVFGARHLAMKVQVAVSSLIYRKVLKLNQSSLAGGGVGQVVNLLANDVSRFNNTTQFLPFLFLGPLAVVVISGTLYWTLGAGSVIGVAVLLAFFPLQMYFAKKASTCRLYTALKTDQRVRLMTEIVTGIKVIKMYTWEKPFAALVAKARKLEMVQIRRSLYLRAFNLVAPVFLGRNAVFFCILVYVLTGGTLKPEYVFVLAALYDTLRYILVIHVPLSMVFLSETVTSVRRIRSFLIQPEMDPVVQSSSGDIVMDKVSAKWTSSLGNVLTQISMKIKSEDLVMVVGQVGAGKTTLLQVILQELPISEGHLQIDGTISYASQVPWLFPGTIRDNILFGEKLDEGKYDEVIRVCQLKHDFSLLPFGDQSLVGERGVLLSGGQKARINLARAVYKKADLYLLDDPLSAVDVLVAKEIFHKCIKEYLAKKTRVLVTHQLQFLESANTIYLVQDGKVAFTGLYQELVNSNIKFQKLLESQVQRGDEDNEKISLVENKEQVEVKEFEQEGAVSKRVYRDYFSSGGTFLKGTIVILLLMLTETFSNGSDFFLAVWINSETSDSTTKHLYIYTALIVSLNSLSLSSSLYFSKFCTIASTNLHNKMFAKIIHSPMRFFNLNPSGRILNRFSKDLSLIDENLCVSMFDTFILFFQTLAIVTIVSIINPWNLIFTIIIFIIFFYYRRMYLATSRSLKRIEGRSRSPIYTHLATSVEGLATIRAFGAQNNQRNRFDEYQDTNSTSQYMFLACSGAFGFWTDWVCVVYLAIVTFSFLFLELNTTGANVGLSINQTLLLTGMLQWSMKQSSELENQMTSVERVVEYSQLPSETDSGTKVVPPSHGRIEFKTVSLRYSPESPLVLKRLSFEILPKEKIGVVGRTGAGKSSLISVLFRLVDFEGTVFVDKVDTKTLSLETLRSRISIIPQEPFLFSGTIRHNLDSFDQYQDPQLWDALEQVEMKTAVSELSSGLSSRVLEGGTNFSVGQKQLLCLARAVVRKNKILVLDEATANVDPQTDRLIQKTIKRVFKECTVLTIAHRLETVLDCDKILVMDDGCVVEFDEPVVLLEKKGVFYRLVKQIGNE